MKKYAATFFAVLMASFCVAAQPIQPSTPQNPSQKDLDDAKQLIAKVLRHFGETLDLTLVRREMYIKDRAMRRLMMESELYELVEKKTVDNLDTPTLERAFLAQENLSWIVWGYLYQEDKDVTFKDFLSVIRPRVWPRLNKRQRIMFQKFFDDHDEIIESRTSKYTSRRELFDGIRMNELIAKALRPIFPKQLRKNFSQAVKIEAYPQLAGDVLGLEDRNTVYVSGEIKGIWGKYTFLLVKKKGIMRIFSSTIHDGSG